jgi:hypothetical protein
MHLMLHETAQGAREYDETHQMSAAAQNGFHTRSSRAMQFLWHHAATRKMGEAPGAWVELL